VALERPDRFAVGLAFGLVAREVVDRFSVTAGAGDGDAVNGGDWSGGWRRDRGGGGRFGLC
jgi:hypothetical protein